MDIEFPEDICWPYKGCGWWPRHESFVFNQKDLEDVGNQFTEVLITPNEVRMSIGVWYPKDWESLAKIVDRPVEEIKIEYVEWLKQMERQLIEDEIEDELKESL